jgi:hypothetical protein
VRYAHYVMDFDHREGTVKRGNLSHLVADGYLCGPSLDAEVAKCDVVCANCHRERTYCRLKKAMARECAANREGGALR